MRGRRARGLSIIELLVVIAILGILVGLVANYWTSYRNQQTVIQQSVLIAGVIDRAKTTARTTSSTTVLTLDTAAKTVSIHTSTGTLIATSTLDSRVEVQYFHTPLATQVTTGQISFVGPYGAANPIDVPAQVVISLGGFKRKLRVVGLGAKVVFEGA